MRAQGCTLAAVVMVLLTACIGGRSSEPSLPSLTFVRCPQDIQIQFLVRHSCVYLTVLEDRSEPNGRAVKLLVVKIPPPDERPRPEPVLVLGGDVGAAPDYGKLQAEAAHLQRVVYILEERGTGHSVPGLSCPEVDRVSVEGLRDPTGDPSLRRRFLTSVMECRERLLSSGIDPADFDLAAMAADVEDLRRALGLRSWNLAAYGSMSRLALEVIREHPDHVRVAYLDSPQFPQLDEPTEAPLGTRLMLDELFHACRAEGSCRVGHPHLRQEWRAAMRRLAAQPIVAHTAIRDVLVDAGSFLRALQAMLGEDLAELPRFPALIREARSGRVDIDVATALATHGSLCAGYRFGCGAHFSTGVYLSVLCRDEAPFVDTSALRRASARFPGLAASARFPGLAAPFGSSPYLVACSAWKVPPAASAMHAPVDASVPVLMLSGQFDPFSPPRLTRELSRSLVNSFAIEAPTLNHQPLPSDGCLIKIRNRWMDDPSSPPVDTRCLRRLKLRFVTR